MMLSSMSDQETNHLVLLAKISLAKAIASGGKPELSAKIKRKLASRPKAQNEVTEWLREILNDFSVNEYTVAAKLAEGLQATKHIVTDSGVFEVPDYFTQHKYLDTAAKLLNLYPPTRQQVGTDGDGIVVRITPQFGWNALDSGEDSVIEYDSEE